VEESVRMMEDRRHRGVITLSQPDFLLLDNFPRSFGIVNKKHLVVVTA